MPQRRWTITKLDLLVAQAIGYTLRPTSAFAPLAIGTTGLPRGAVASYYSQTLGASGGIPFYKWTVVSGALPGGLTLDSFNGAITGTPTAVGTFAFTVELRDYDTQTAPITQSYSLRMEATAFLITAIQRSGADMLVKFTTLSTKTYRVEYKDDLSVATWTTLGASVGGTGSVVSVTDAGAASLPKRFYRALEL